MDRRSAMIVFTALMQVFILIMLTGSTWYSWRSNKNMLAINQTQRETIENLMGHIQVLEHRLRVLEMRNSLIRNSIIMGETKDAGNAE